MLKFELLAGSTPIVCIMENGTSADEFHGAGFTWDQTHGFVEATFALSGSGKFGGTTAFSWVPGGYQQIRGLLRRG